MMARLWWILLKEGLANAEKVKKNLQCSSREDEGLAEEEDEVLVLDKMLIVGADPVGDGPDPS
jgi:hypothetical protein